MLTGRQKTHKTCALYPCRHALVIKIPQTQAKVQNWKSDKKVNLAVMACTWMASLVVSILCDWLMSSFPIKRTVICTELLWLNICHDADQPFASKPRLSSQPTYYCSCEFGIRSLFQMWCTGNFLGVMALPILSEKYWIHNLKWSRSNEQCEREQ